MTTQAENEQGSAIRIGMLRLTDAAPLVVAVEKHFFAARRLDVRVIVEPSWANVADKLSYGHLEAAVMLPPLALAMAMGLRGRPVPLTVPMGLSANGNSITVSTRIADAIDDDGANVMEVGRRFGLWIRARRVRPRLAVVHSFSTHNFLLRYWLAAAGIDPDEEVDICTIPPPETAQALKAGEIDGFCAGAPWGLVASAGGAGRTVVVSNEIWRNHPEKCLAVGSFAAREPETLSRLVDALLEAARYCDDARNAPEVAALLAQPAYLDVEAAFLRASLPRSVEGAAPKRAAVDRSIFAAHHASIPRRAHAAWFLSQMARWRYLARPVDGEAVVDAVYRPNYVQALAHDAVTSEGERFCDGARFDAEKAFAELRGR